MSDGSHRCYLAEPGADISFISSSCFDSKSLSALIVDLNEAFRAARWGNPAVSTGSGKWPVRFLFSASGKLLGITRNFNSELGLSDGIHKWKSMASVDEIGSQ